VKKLIFVAVLIVFRPSLALAQLGTASGTTTVNVTVGAEAALSIVTGTTTLASAGTNFSSYTGTTNLAYFVRTSAASGSGTITVQVTSDFSPAGGPSVATPPTAGDALKYTCTVAAPGNNGTATACSGSVTASTASATSVGTFGADARSLIGGNSAAVAWTLTNDPKYKTGAYSGTVTFTISAS
jgi:hypothetical protein